MQAISILIAESHYLVREGLKAILSDLPYLHIIGEALNEKQLISKLEYSSPEIVIIDYHENEFRPKCIKTIFDICPTTNVLVITSDINRDSIFEVLRYGAKGFLLKNCDKEEIVGAIHAMAKNEKFFCNKVLDILLERQMSKPEEACEPTQLTERESEIVTLMAEGLTTQQIASKLFLSVHTIYTHRKNIMKKLKVTTAAEVILYGINSAQERM